MPQNILNMKMKIPGLNVPLSSGKGGKRRGGLPGFPNIKSIKYPKIGI